MKALTLRLDETEYERLRSLAYVEDRSMSDVIREAIREYIAQRASPDAFRNSMEQGMRENAELFANLPRH